MNRQDGFRDQLLAAQQFTPEYRERYIGRLNSMLTRQLTPARRVLCSVLAVCALLGGISFGVQAITGDTRGDSAVWGRAILGLLAVWAVAFAAMLSSMAIRGSINLRGGSSAIARMRCAFFFGIAIVLLVVGGLQLRYEPGSSAAILSAIVGLAFLVLAALIAINNTIRQSELNVQEKLLETELRLAEMNDKLEKGLS